MGLSSSKSKSWSSSVTNPTPPSWLQGPYQDLAGRASGLLSADPTSFTTGANANMTSAWNRAGQGSSANPAMAAVSNYTPDAVTAGLLDNIDISQFMSPYTSQVIDAGVSDLDRARRMAINGNSSNATLAQGGNAFMSDRAGVADGETNRGFLDSVGSLTANLRNAGFNTALGSAIDVGKYNIGNKLNADQFNVSAGLQGANTRLAGAQALAGNERADTLMQGQMGEQQRQVESETNPQVAYLKQMAAIAALLNGVPIEAFTGQTTTGEQTVKTSQSGLSSLGSLLGGLGGLFGGIGSLGKGALQIPSFAS